MTDETPGFDDLLRSPYDDAASTSEREGEGVGDLSWKPPVVAAVVGAVLVSIFVVYSIVSEPQANDVTADTVPRVATDSTPVQSTELAPGYVASASEIGYKIESAADIPGSLIFAVSSVVAGAVDPAEVPPDSIAYWELESNAGTETMDAQLAEKGALGNTTVVFNGVSLAGAQRLVAYAAEDSTQRSTTLDMSADLSPEGTEFAIDMGNGSVINGELWIGSSWGFVDWSVEGMMTAKLDVVVTFVGTDDPSTDDVDETRLISGHSRPLAPGSGAIEEGPLYGYTGRFKLFRSGEPVNDVNVPTAVHVEFFAEVVTEVAEPVVLEASATD